MPGHQRLELHVRMPRLKSTIPEKVRRLASVSDDCSEPSRLGSGFPTYTRGAVAQSTGGPPARKLGVPPSHLMLVGLPLGPRSALTTLRANAAYTGNPGWNRLPNPNSRNFVVPSPNDSTLLSLCD